MTNSKYPNALVCVLFFAGVICLGGNASADEGKSNYRKRWYINPDVELQKDVRIPEYYFKVPNDITDDEIREMVKRLFQEDDNNHNFARLDLVGERAMPMLVEGLRDPRVASAKFQGEDPIGGETPLERIVSLIEPFGPPDAASLLIPLAKHEDPYFRGEAAEGLASIATADCVAPLTALLFDSERYPRASAILGIDHVLGEKRATDEFKKGIFPALQKDLAKDETDWVMTEMMLEIDKERTLPIILAGEMLSVDNPNIGDLLDVLNRKSVVLPLGNLLPLIKAIQERGPVDEYPSAYAEALKLYARNPDDKTEEMVRAGLKSEDALVKYAGLDSLVILAGMSDPIEHSRELLETQKLEELSKPQQYCYCIDRYLFDLADGGHRFYFASTWGSESKILIEAFQAIGKSDAAKAVIAAAEIVGVDVTRTDQDHDPTEKLTEEQRERLWEVEERFEIDADEIYPALTFYSLKNPQHFPKSEEITSK